MTATEVVLPLDDPRVAQMRSALDSSWSGDGDADSDDPVTALCATLGAATHMVRVEVGGDLDVTATVALDGPRAVSCRPSPAGFVLGGLLSMDLLAWIADVSGVGPGTVGTAVVRLIEGDLATIDPTHSLGGTDQEFADDWLSRRRWCTVTVIARSEPPLVQSAFWFESAGARMWSLEPEVADDVATGVTNGVSIIRSDALAQVVVLLAGAGWGHWDELSISVD